MTHQTFDLDPPPSKTVCEVKETSSTIGADIKDSPKQRSPKLGAVLPVGSFR